MKGMSEMWRRDIHPVCGPTPPSREALRPARRRFHIGGCCCSLSPLVSVCIFRAYCRVVIQSTNWLYILPKMHRMNCLLNLLVCLFAAVEMTIAGRFKVKCSEDRVTAKAGDDDVIQCRFKTGNKIGSVAFVWKKADTMAIVYNYPRNQSNQTEQDPSYRNRAEVFPNEIPYGNLSLRLRNVSLLDSGIYKLHISSRSQDSNAQVFLSIRVAQQVQKIVCGIGIMA